MQPSRKWAIIISYDHELGGREAQGALNAAAGGTVAFAPSLFGTNYGTPATITLTSSFPTPTKSFNFAGPGPALLTLSGATTPGSIPGNTLNYALSETPTQPPGPSPSPA